MVSRTVQPPSNGMKRTKLNSGLNNCTTLPDGACLVSIVGECASGRCQRTELNPNLALPYQSYPKNLFIYRVKHSVLLNLLFLSSDVHVGTLLLNFKVLESSLGLKLFKLLVVGLLDVDAVPSVVLREFRLTRNRSWSPLRAWMVQQEPHDDLELDSGAGSADGSVRTPC